MIGNDRQTVLPNLDPAILTEQERGRARTCLWLITSLRVLRLVRVADRAQLPAADSFLSLLGVPAPRPRPGDKAGQRERLPVPPVQGQELVLAGHDLEWWGGKGRGRDLAALEIERALWWA